MKIVYEAYRMRYKLALQPKAEQALFKVIGGYMQYLQLGLISLNEANKQTLTSEEDVLSTLLADERIALQSEELWESLSAEEQKVLLQVANTQTIDAADFEKNRYLWDTGFIFEKNGVHEVFSPLFAAYLRDIDHEESRKKKTAGESSKAVLPR